MPRLTANNYFCDEKNIYYTGIASGMVYRQPFNARTWELCQSIQTLTWEEVWKINREFIKNHKRHSYEHK